MKSSRLTYILLGVGVLLLIPFVAMQFTNEVNWSLFDFVIAGVLLTGTSLLCDLSIRKLSKRSYKIMACVAFVVLLILVWVELAVGVFGTPFAGS